MTDTSLIDDIAILSTSRRYRWEGSVPRRRPQCVCFLLGDAASYVSGANVRVGGGRPPGTFLG